MTAKTESRAVPAAEWVKFLERAGVLGDVHGKATGTRTKAIAAGKYLSAKVGRTVPVAVNGRTGNATLRAVEVRARERKYWFEVVWDEVESAASSPSAEPKSPPPDETARQPEAPIPAPEPVTVPNTGTPLVKDGNEEQWE